MKKVVLINGSPRHEEKTASAGFLSRIGSTLKDEEYDKQFIGIRGSLIKGPENDYASMLEADALIIAFPLYYFCLPGLLMRFLEDYAKFRDEHGNQKKSAKVYAIINCGFPEPDINLEAVRVIRCFSRRIEGNFRFGVMIGGGPMISSVDGIGPVRKAYEKFDEGIRTMAEDIKEESSHELPSIMIKPNFPQKLYYFMGGLGWKQQAKKNGLKTSDLYRRPNL